MNKRSDQRVLSREKARRDAADAFLLQADELLLKRYRPLETIGAGGYGMVFSAWDEQLKRRVAIKEIPLETDERGAVVGLDEARTAALLTHPSIVTVYDFVTEGDRAYIIMEYVDGITLAELPDEYCTDDVVASVAKALGGALDKAHKNGVLHLDIKPRNILINHDGRIKIIDFGLARLSSPDGHGSAEGGTVGYMPLEQLEGDPADETTDEWAAAAVLYELITGEFPYEEETGGIDTVDAMLAAQRAADPELLRTDDARLDDVFMTALSRNADERYDSVKSFIYDLMEYLGDPKVGREDLKDAVAEIDEIDELPEEVERDRVRGERDTDEGGWRPSPGQVTGIIGRTLLGFATALILWHIFFAGDVLGGESLFVPLGIALIGGIIAGIAPRLGLPIAGGVGLLALGAAGHWLVASIGLLALAIWWYLIGRARTWLSVTGLIWLLLFFELDFAAANFLEERLSGDAQHYMMVTNIILAVLFVLLSVAGLLVLRRRKELPSE